MTERLIDANKLLAWVESKEGLLDIGSGYYDRSLGNTFRDIISSGRVDPSPEAGRTFEAGSADKSILNAEKAMQDILKLDKYLPEDYRESVMNIIRLELIKAYRNGWKDSEKYFDEK